jgi:hypothetical protein
VPPPRLSGHERRTSPVGQSASGGIRRESSSSCITHAHLAADPRATDIDSVPRSGDARLLLVEKVQDVFGADGGPLRQRPVMLVGQRSAAARGANPASLSIISASATRSAAPNGTTKRDCRDCAGNTPVVSAALCASRRKTTGCAASLNTYGAARELRSPQSVIVEPAEDRCWVPLNAHFQ